MAALIIKPVIYLRNLLNKGHTRSVTAKKNILAALLIKGLSVSIGFLLVPLTLQYVDSRQYGIWITLSSMTAWLTFFDIGFGNGLRNKFTEAVAQGKHKLARVYVSTTYAVITFIVVLLLVFFFSLNPFLDWAKILNAPESMANELSILARIVFTFFCIQFVLQLVTTILTANQESAKASLCNFAGTLILFGVIFTLTKTTSGNLIYLGMAYGFSTVLVLAFCSFWFYAHHYKKYAPSVGYVRFIFGSKMASIGIQFLIIQIGALVLFQTDNIIIAQLFGPEEVTQFNISYKLFSCIIIVFTIVVTPFWSAFTDAYSKNDFKWIQSLFVKIQKIWAMLFLATIILLIASPYVFEFWVGKTIQIPWALSVVMVMYTAAHAWLMIPCYLLNGIGKIRLQLYLYIICIFTNIPISIVLGKWLGLPGVALGNFFIFLFMNVILTVQANKILSGKASGIWVK